jgi:hypothetical protein
MKQLFVWQDLQVWVKPLLDVQWQKALGREYVRISHLGFVMSLK